MYSGVERVSSGIIVFVRCSWSVVRGLLYVVCCTWSVVKSCIVLLAEA